MGFNFPFCYNENFGQYPNEPKRPNGDNPRHRGHGWVSLSGDINKLITIVSGREVDGTMYGGASIATCSFSNDNRNTDNLLHYGAVALDIDAKHLPIDLKNSLIPSPEEIRGQTSFGQYIAAMFPTGSAEPEVHSMIGRIIIPLEKPISVNESGGKEAAEHKIKNLLYHLYMDLLESFPSMHKSEIDELLKSMGLAKGSGGIDFTGLTAVQYWAGMRPDQKPFYINDEAYLPQAFINEYPLLSVEELDKAIDVMKRKKNSFGGRDLGTCRNSQSNSGNYSSHSQDYFKYINSQIVEDAEWLIMNILPPPDEGTYDTWFKHVEHFCCTHAEYFADIYVEFCQQSEHRLKTGDPRYRIERKSWNTQGWSKLAEALDYIDDDWEETFFQVHGRYCAYGRNRPRRNSHLRPLLTWILKNAT